MSYLMPNFAGSSGGTQNVEPFPDPFMDYASTAMPSSLQSAMRWCEYIMLANGVYRSAIDRVIAYFITEVEIDGTDRDGKEKYLNFLDNTLGIHALLRQIALDYVTYGNFFASVVVPFRRNLACPDCGFEAPLRRIYGNEKFSYSWSGYDFNATCPFCKYSGKWTHINRRSHEEDDLVVKRWSPHEMELIWDPYTDTVGHIWRIPQHYKTYINKGTLFHLERVPWEVVQAVKHGTHIEFNKDVIYHGKEDTLAGVLNKGWGVSRVLTNFRQAWYVQVLHRYNEAIGLDYIIPFRVLTPEPRPGGAGGGEHTDPLFTADLGGFTGQVNNMLRQRRRDPTSWFTLPFPLKYQALGGEASQLVPYELMNQGLDTLLSSVGIPVQFYKGDLTVQAAPAALRLMESHWSHLTHILNNFLQWICNKISIALSWDEVTVRLARPSHADDLNRQLAVLQLMMGGQVSQTTGLRRGVGLLFEEEQKRMLEEQKFIAEESQKAQEELEAAGLGDQLAMDPMAAGPGGGPMGAAGGMGAMPGPGAGGQVPPVQPGAMGGAAPMGGAPAAGMQPGMPMDPVQAVMAQLPMGNEAGLTPQDLDSIAQTVAQQIFGMAGGQRQSALRQLKQRNPTIHSLVKSLLEQLDGQAESRGRQLGQQEAQMAQQQSMAPQPTGMPPGM